ncbi:hypothetical protein [Streptomyces sp. CA-106131]|uniref:hypothetical protein n=1 Tax=Streptomyces sp. CA-106131 TaxID=3240045 RepID=UPI003D8AF3A2
MSLCVICRRTTAASACQPCEARLRGILDCIPGWYDALEHDLIPSQRAADDVPVKTSKVHAPIPVNLHVLNLRSKGGIVTTLREWETDLRVQRGEGVPVFAGDLRQTLTATVGYLTGTLAWAMTQYDKMRDLAGALDWVRSTCEAATGARVKLRYIGTCPEILDDHQECGRSLRVGPDDIEITCICGTSWPRTRWVQLATAMRAGA